MNIDFSNCGISFDDFKVIVSDIFKFPEICGEFSNESADFIDRLRYLWHSNTAYSSVCVEYDTMKSHGKCWKITRGNCQGYGHTLAETLKDEREKALKIARFTY